tara:strand:- start:239 stop:523 length:285 start_codon:yes stop_codon:yes gene_type:complete
MTWYLKRGERAAHDGYMVRRLGDLALLVQAKVDEVVALRLENQRLKDKANRLLARLRKHQLKASLRSPRQQQCNPISASCAVAVATLATQADSN